MIKDVAMAHERHRRSGKLAPAPLRPLGRVAAVHVGVGVRDPVRTQV